jgi:hypothetical protein
MAKKIIYHGLFILNVVLLIMAFGQVYLFAKGYSADALQTFMLWRTNLTLFGLAFLIWNIVIWSKRDKKVGRFLALFFLPGLYTLFYYRIVLKNNWLDKQE